MNYYKWHLIKRALKHQISDDNKWAYKTKKNALIIFVIAFTLGIGYWVYCMVHSMELQTTPTISIWFFVLGLAFLLLFEIVRDSAYDEIYEKKKQKIKEMHNHGVNINDIIMYINSP